MHYLCHILYLRCMHTLDHLPLFACFDAIQAQKTRQSAVQNIPRNSLQAFLHVTSQAKSGSGFQRMQKCR